MEPAGHDPSRPGTAARSRTRAAPAPFRLTNASRPREKRHPARIAFRPGYRIEEVIGCGGMGVIYRARQLRANRVVALKMIRAGHHADRTEAERFRCEVEAVARLQHPHVV